MSEVKQKLSSIAYGGCKGEDYEPFIPVSKVMPETTKYSIVIGVILACIFAAANTYLGLKVGMTIASAVPGAIVATGVLRGAFKRNNLLESNLACSLASMGEAVAGGAIYILPALILSGFNLSIWTIVIVIIVGGTMGIFFITPVRKYLVVEEHGNLLYPEGMAAAEVLITGSQGGSAFKSVLAGFGLGSLYKLCSSGFKLFGEQTTYIFKSYHSTMIGLDTLASVLGVGFIVGSEVGLLMFGGSLVAWFGIIPLIKFFGSGLHTAIFPSVKLVSDMSAMEIWSNYIKYIGAGAVAMGGFISLGKSLPTIISSFKQALGGMGQGEGHETKSRLNLETPMVWVLIAACVGFFLTWLLPMINGGIVGGIMAVIFSFFFVVVSARMVGIIGVSNNPVSGMSIASLLFIAIAIKLSGFTGQVGIEKTLLVTAVVCAAISVAGATSQSLKTTFIIGGTPKNNQMIMWIGMICCTVFAAVVVKMLDSAYGLGTVNVPAPQATLMKMLTEGIMAAKLPWTLVFIGAFIAIACELAKVPILPVALGIYLPITLNAAILTGGLVRTFTEMRFKKNKDAKEESVSKGILTASGLVAGGAIMGIVVAVFATLKIDIGFGVNIIPSVTQSNWLPFVMFLILCLWFYFSSVKAGKEVEAK